MRILFVTDDFPPLTHTGPSIVAYQLAQALLSVGHEVFVITSVQEKKIAGQSDYNGLTIHRLYTDFPPRYRNYLSLYNPQVVPAFKKIIAAVKPDVCHFHNVHDYLSYACFKAARRSARAVFLTTHDLMLISYGKLMPKNGNCNYRVSFWDNLSRAKKRYNPFRNLVIRHYLKYLDKIFCITAAQKDVLATNNIFNTATIHNAIEADYWQIEPSAVIEFKEKFGLTGKKVVMFGGRLSIAKGGDAIFAVMEKVTAAVDNAVLLVVGTINDYARELMARAAEKNFSDKVIFTGWLNREEIGRAFFSATVCVTPSVYFDPFNLFNIEAMAAGKPVVGTCFGGTPEIIIDGVTGYIANPLETETYAAKIIELLNEPAKAERFGLAGRQRVMRDFSLAKQLAETLAWYEKFLSA